MPKNALNSVKVDYCLPISEMGNLLNKLIPQKIPKHRTVPEDVKTEAKIAERVLSDLSSVIQLGSFTIFDFFF